MDWRVQYVRLFWPTLYKMLSISYADMGMSPKLNSGAHAEHMRIGGLTAPASMGGAILAEQTLPESKRHLDKGGGAEWHISALYHLPKVRSK